jgi:hypothetical protein
MDWSLSLRGGYVKDAQGERFETMMLPSVSVQQSDARSSFRLNANADFAKSGGDPMRIGALRLGLITGYNFDRLTSLTGAADFSLTQDSPNVPGAPSNVSGSPVVVAGSAQLGFSRKISRFDIALRGTVERDVYGPTTFTDASQLFHTDLNRSIAGVGLRVSHPITPIVAGFADASASWDMFDAASPTLLVKLDGANYALRAGFSANWGTALQAEASVGVGMRKFSDPSVAEVRAALYDASLTFRPNDTVTLTGAFSSAIGPPGVNSTGTAQVEYAAVAGLAYQVNRWLALRASAGWHSAETEGSGATDKGYDLGVGSDYALNQRTKLTLDYKFSHSQVTPTPAEDSHRITVGVTIKR